MSCERRSPLTCDVPAAFIPRAQIRQRLEQLAPAIKALRALVDAGELDEPSLEATVERQPDVTYVLQLLFVAPAGAGFADGSELPEHPPETRMLDAGSRRTAETHA